MTNQWKSVLGLSSSRGLEIIVSQEKDQDHSQKVTNLVSVETGKNKIYWSPVKRYEL